LEAQNDSRKISTENGRYQRKIKNEKSFFEEVMTLDYLEK